MGERRYHPKEIHHAWNKQSFHCPAPNLQNLPKEFVEYGSAQAGTHDDQVDVYAVIARYLKPLPWYKRLWRWLMKRLD